MKIILYSFVILFRETFQTDDGQPNGQPDGQPDDFSQIATHLKNQVPYKTLQNYMTFEGYDESDWDADWKGIVQSFLEEGSSKKADILKQKVKRTQALSADDKEYMLRFLQLKYAVLFLQEEKSFGKYCFYGCWCLPRGASEIGAGFGIPVDPIDEACKDYSTCYNCLYSQIVGRRCSEDDQGNYKMAGKHNPVTGDKQLICEDPIGSCLRMRCECDLDLAMKFGALERAWNGQYHRTWGNFDSSSCRNNHRTGAEIAFNLPQNTVYNDRIGFGTFGDDFVEEGGDNTGIKNVLKSPNDERHSVLNGEVVGCCGTPPRIHYYHRDQKCCPDGQITSINAPCDADFL